MLEKIEEIYLKYVVGYRNPKRYWNQRWRLNLKLEWTQQIINNRFTVIRQTLNDQDCNNILEVGCGIAPLRNLKGYLGLDFSLDAIQQSGLKEAVYADITSHIPLSYKSFDATLAISVLFHIPPSKIERAIAEISRVTRKCLIIIEPEYNPERTCQKHCFNHNLPEIIKKYFDGKIIFPVC